MWGYNMYIVCEIYDSNGGRDRKKERSMMYARSGTILSEGKLIS